MDKFLPKPLFPSMIVDMINECIGIDNAMGMGTASPWDDKADQQDDFSKNTILLAEDVEINREIVLALLEPTNLTVECAETGAQAVKIFEEAPELYEMIFMDIQMPEMDGYEATRKIRALGAPEARSVPIIAMTANVFKEDVEKCLETGMDGHVGKPLDFDEVLRILSKYLK